MTKRKKTIAIIGPTASGKSSIAIELAKQLNSEVISCDSRLVFKDFNIGTAKPTIEEMQGIKHHFIDIIDPLEDYSAQIFAKDGQKIIHNLFEQNKIPIVAGGTGFYVKSLLGGLDIPKVEPNEEYRTELKQLAEDKGNEYLHKILEEKDPVMAQKLHHNDKFRVIRALEVIKALNIPMSEAQTMKENDFDVVYVGLNSENREFLYERVNKRVEIMIEQGLVDEVKNLVQKYGKTISILKTLGYKEICSYLDGEISLADSIELIKKNTRNFAKRQLTWFRANDKINWFYIDKMSQDDIIEGIRKLYDV